MEGKHGLKTSWKRRLLPDIHLLEKRLRRELNNPRLVNRKTFFEQYMNSVFERTIEGFIVNDLEFSIPTDEEFDVVSELLENYLVDNFLDSVKKRFTEWHKK